ncbi:tetratricopeptide repeat protein [Duganella dendranthematis]|uniref:Tetratricopeptide repeat protein n=1 Tax=Duganella dendranthematis TaxID=2728021 RepID=A0ABX6M5V5_9BURK|nr:tetratricopeptide repeat protein [Duganella dendranthematis]QJD89684.1 tetratricopeptide repeat protein [Duganella dendranthematis]
MRGLTTLRTLLTALLLWQGAPLAAQTLTAADHAAPASEAASDSGDSPTAPSEPRPVQNEALYLEALRALAADQPERANELLQRFVKDEPLHAGAWLDLAFTECTLGHSADAERLFREIEARFKPPPGIMELIEQHRARGCNQKPSWRPLWAVSLGRGYDNNVNQGASSNLFTTGSGSDSTQWELSPDFLPKPDHQTTASFDYMQQADEAGSLVLAQVRLRQNDHVHEQDTASVLLGYERPWEWGRWRGYGTVAVSVLQLQGQLYQRQEQVQLRATPPLAQRLPEELQWSLLASMSHVRYPTRTKFDANIVELGTNFYWRGARQWSFSLSGMADQGQNGRLGGDRHGWYSALQLSQPVTASLRGDLGWSRQVWHSSEVYAPGQIDLVRHQDTRQLRASLQYTLAPHHSVQLEWRAIRNQENISLFQYNSRSIQLNWRWDNF